MRQVWLLVLVPLVGLSSCGDEDGAGPPPAAPRVVDLGDGVSATLSADGALSIRSGDRVVLASTSLASRAVDAERPDVWHDPADAERAFVPIPAAALALEAVPGDGSSTKALRVVVPAQAADTALVRLSLTADDGFYGGLGERFDHADARGRIVPMHLAVRADSESSTNEAHVPVPFLVSSRGWGLFVRTHEAGAFDVAKTDARAVHATFEGRALEATLYVDGDPLAIAARFARDTGLPRPLPRWALSPMHWRNEWASAAEVLADAAELRRRKIPASSLWIDNPWQTAYNTHRFDAGRFADPEGMMRALAASGFRAVAWTTPYLEKPGPAGPANEAQQLYAQAAAAGHLVRYAQGEVFSSPADPVKATGGGMIDFTSDGASAFWSGIVDRATAAGFRGFKVDYGEDLVPTLLSARLGVRLADGTTERTARRYPLLEHRAIHASLDRAAPGDGVLIARASSWGGAAQADVIWPGDLDNGFERAGDPGKGILVGGLPAAVVAAQTLATSGFPAFGSDTGGYRGGKPTREALLRWAEHTALSVVMQLGGGGTDHNPWTYDEEAAELYAGLARLHQQLVPYLEDAMRAARERGTPSVRSLPLAFPADRQGYERADREYLLGPDLLCAPVVTSGAILHDVYPPPGVWVSWWDDRMIPGEVVARVPAVLGTPMLFARAGAIVPLLPPGIDTVVEADAPGVVALPQRAGELWARAWVRGPSRYTWSSGAQVVIAEGASGVEIGFTPASGSESLVIDVDVRTRTAAGALTTVVPDLPMALALSAAQVQAAAGDAWFYDEARGHLVARFTRRGVIRVAP